MKLTATQQAIAFCRSFIESAEAIDWKDDDEVFNFLDAGIDVLIERLRIAEKRAHEELRERFTRKDSNHA